MTKGNSFLPRLLKHTQVVLSAWKKHLWLDGTLKKPFPLGRGLDGEIPRHLIYESDFGIGRRASVWISRVFGVFVFLK